MISSTFERLNARRDAAGDAGEDAGFTLIELMVVLLILAILLAIAIPTFLGVTKSANDRAAQSNLNTALVNAKSSYQQNQQSYTGVNQTTLTADEPSLTYVSGAAAPSTGQGVISMYTSADGNGVVLAAFSKSNNCWILVDNTSGVSNAAPNQNATTYNGATAPGSVPLTAGTWYGKIAGTTSASCNAVGPLTGATYQSTGFSS